MGDLLRAPVAQGRRVLEPQVLLVEQVPRHRQRQVPGERKGQEVGLVAEAPGRLRQALLEADETGAIEETAGCSPKVWIRMRSWNRAWQRPWPSLVESSLRTCPASFRLCDREGNVALEVGGDEVPAAGAAGRLEGE